MLKVKKTYVTVKIPVEFSSTEDLNLLLDYQRQQTHIVRSVFKCCQKGIPCNFNSFNHYNDTDLLDSWWKQSAVYEGKAKHQPNLNASSVCFGGKQTMRDYKSGKITKDELRIKRLNPLVSVGEKDSGTKRTGGNRKFKLSADASYITVKFKERNVKALIKAKLSNNYRKVLLALAAHQQAGDIPVTYKIDSHFVYITYAVEDLIISEENKESVNSILDRIFSIDLNPNYIGWSVVDWKSHSGFSVVDSGVVSLKRLNDEENRLIREEKLNSSDSKRKKFNNKRQYETLISSQELVKIALHYQCSIFATEGLSIESKDGMKGKKYNRLVNNQWNRDSLVNNLKKRCAQTHIAFLEVMPDYSSFVGNFLFRQLNMNLPDMCLASIEIGRRGYEFYHQHIIKDVLPLKNIIFPRLDDFKSFYEDSVEEFDIESRKSKSSLKDVYYKLKDAKITYRVSLD